MEFVELLHKGLIHCNLEAATKDDVLQHMAAAMHEQGYVKKAYIAGVRGREATNPTGLQLEKTGCAIPHSEMSYVTQAAISVATLQQPVMFQRMDDFSAPVAVELVFMLAVNEGLKQVNTLQELMGVLQNNEKIDELLQAANAEDMLAILNNL